MTHSDPYCVTHCRPGVKHSQCGCSCDHRYESGLYIEALKVCAQRTHLTRERFQRLMRVGFMTRDRLLIDLEDERVIRRLPGDRGFNVYSTRAQWLLAKAVAGDAS